MDNPVDPALQASPLLDYDHPRIQRLIARRGWASLPVQDMIGAIYEFVRDEIAFGYNETDAIPASKVLHDGYGQCNTKAILLLALLRAVGVPCVLRGATTRKRLQKGIVRGPWYWLAPLTIFHTWVEAQSGGQTVALEGVILDKSYILGLRCMLPSNSGALLGYGVGTEHWEAPPIEWQGENTAIQQTAIIQDLGRFVSPDAFYEAHGSNLSGFRAFAYRHLVRHLMNARVARIRARHTTNPCYDTGVQRRVIK